MGASRYEQELAQTDGVTIHHWAQPLRLLGNKNVIGIEFSRTEYDKKGKLKATDDTFVLDADVVFKAIGQKLAGDDVTDLKVQNGRIVVDDSQATSLDDVWAGGDCVTGGDDLTVSAVQHGKVAAIAIDSYLRN